MTQAIAEKPTTIASPDAGLPRLERPRQPKVSAPAIDEKLAEADAAGQRAATAAQEQEQARNAARHLSIRIETLRKKRGELAERLQNLEDTDVPGHRARCEASVKRLLGVPRLDQNQTIELNSALTTLPALQAKEKLLPGILKDVKSELASVTAELAKLESSPDGGR